MGRQKNQIGRIAWFGLVGLLCLAGTASAAEATASGASISPGMIAIGAAIAIGLAAIATAWAQVSIGSAAVGAMAENEALFGKGLILTALPETIVIFGLLVALQLLEKV